MAQSYISLKKTATVIIGYICSGCGFPIISLATILTNATQYYTFSQYKAQETAEEKCDDAIQFETSRIRNCFENEDVLSLDMNTVPGYHYGSSCESSIKDISTPCPNCFNLEKWQVPSGNSLDCENYPTIFENIESAENWAKRVVADLMRQIDEKRSNKNTVDRAQKNAIKLSVDNNELEQSLLAIPELSKKSNLEQEKSIIMSQQKNLAIFDFKGNKILKTKLKCLNEELQALKAIISQKETEYYNLIHANMLELQKIQPIAFGYSNDVVINQDLQSFVYLISPNEIPCEEENLSTDDSLNEETLTTAMDMQKILFCRKCGFKLLPDSDFCSKCGNKIEEAKL